MGELYSDLTLSSPQKLIMMNPDVCGTFETMTAKTRWTFEKIDVIEMPEEEDSDDIPLVVQDLKDKAIMGYVGNALGRSQQERLEKKSSSR